MITKFQAGACKFFAGDRVKRIRGVSEYIVMGHIFWPTWTIESEPKPPNYLCINVNTGSETEIFEEEMTYA